MTAEAPKRDWKAIVEESNGTLRMAPEKFHDRIREWDANRRELTKLANAAAKHELTTRMQLETLVMDVRAYLEESGVEGVYLKDVGFETGALDEGVFVLNVTKAV